MKKTKSDFGWVAGRQNDEFVVRAKREGYRSRASFKLIEINEKFRLLKPGMIVVDIGAAPGGWTQVALKEVGSKGKVIGVDILEMEGLRGADFVKGDFSTDETLRELMGRIDGVKLDLVISDMAPNLSGIKEIDQPRAIYLIELVIKFGKRVLKPGGDLLVKCFEGEGISQLRKELLSNFRQLSNIKPKASRPKSRELYMLGRGFLP